MKLRSHPLLNLNEEKENRYVVTMDMYVYAKDDYMARVESHKLADLLKNKYDNQASVLDIVEQPFGTMGNRKLKNTSKPTGKDEEMPFESFNPINLNVQDDIAILSGDSGEYQGEIEDGKVSFSVIYDDLDTRITDQYDESNIEEFLGRDHAFVELSKKYDHSWDIEPDLVGITINLNKINEANMPINSPVDLIDSDILDIPDGSVGEIKRAAAKLGIDPQNKFESELRDEIEDLLTSPMSTYEEYELVKRYFGDYADELIHDYGLKIDEVNENYYKKASDLNRKDIEHKLEMLLDKVKPSPKNIEARQGLRAALNSNNVVMMKKALDYWSNKLGIEEDAIDGSTDTDTSVQDTTIDNLSSDFKDAQSDPVGTYLRETEYIDAIHENEEYCPKCAAKIKKAIREEIKKVAKEAKTKPAKGKRFAKKVKGKGGRTRTVSYGQAGKAKGGGDRIRPGTAKGHAYCARSAKIKKCKNPPCANTLSRKKWKCKGSRSVPE